MYITAAQNFDEVLLTPSNPKSPYKEMLSNNLYKKFEVRSDIFRKAKVLTDLYDRYGVNHIFFDVFGWLWVSGLWGSGESAFHAAQLSYIHQKQGGDKAFTAMLKDLQQKGMVPGYYETYNAMQVKYGYAVTCHKAQGGQWRTVFLDQGYTPPEGVNNDYFRWLYTAFTRATERLYLVNWPPQCIE